MSYYQILEVSIELLQRVRLANRGRLLLRTPGPVPFGTCICSNVESILSWNLSCLRTFWVSNTPRYFYFTLYWILMVGWFYLRIYVALVVFQPYRDLEAGHNQSLKIQVARPGFEPGPLDTQAKSLTTQPPLLPTWFWWLFPFWRRLFVLILYKEDYCWLLTVYIATHDNEVFQFGAHVGGHSKCYSQVGQGSHGY